MQFEQISLHRIPLKSGRTLSDVDAGGHVVPKIDWLTVIFQDCSLNHVLSWLQQDDCVSEFCASIYELSRGYDQVFTFRYNDILLETSAFGFYGYDQDEALFDVIVPKIRLELSGTALDFLRAFGIDMDTYRFAVPVLPEGASYHFTRCDWAFDLLDYKPTFIDNLIDHIYTHSLPSGRVPIASSHGAISYKVVTGDQKTVYLGSPQSDRMLRCYDKRLQYIDRNTGAYVKSDPYGQPDSWLRIEWQTRNKLAHNLVLDSSLEFKHILRKIFDTYAFAEGNQGKEYCNHARSVVSFWSNLFPWKDIESRIIQNLNFVQLVSPDDRVISTFQTIMVRNFMFAYSLLGASGIEKICEDYLASLMRDDPASVRRRIAFYNRLNQLSVSRELSHNRDFGLFNNSGRLSFKL